MSMKRIIAIILAFLLLPILPGCKAPEESGKLKIVCTLFPQYDWVMNILGEHADEMEVTLLAPGTDLHSYEASAADIVAISESDLFIYIGNESEGWIEDALKITGTTGRLSLALSQTVSLLPLPHEHTEEEHHHTYDEHTWLSLKNAMSAVIEITRCIAALDFENKEDYWLNATNYNKELTSLSEQYQNMTEQAPSKTLVFADRYPFRYLAEDYGLTCYAAFDGCSAETEAGAATILNLAEQIDRNKLNAVIIIDQSKPDLAQTVIESTREKNQQILRLNSMQAITAHQIEEGISYLDIMNENLHALKAALEKGE